MVTSSARRRFVQQLGAIMLAPPLVSAARAQPRVNGPALLEIEAGHYRFAPAGQVYCGGVRPDDGYQVIHAMLRPRLPLADGYSFIEHHLKTLSLPVQALCGMELRVPAAMTFDAFRTFNGPYVEQLRKWDLMVGNYSAVCRTNVAPAYDAPSQACVQAFSYVAPAKAQALTFCLSGTADIDPRGKIVAAGDTSASGMSEKLKHVIEVIGVRLSELELRWHDATHIDLYAAADVSDAWGKLILPTFGIAAQPGVRFHYARPPIIGSEVELEARGLVQEITLTTKATA